MRKLLAIAALVLASTAAAQAQYTFDYGGRTVRIDPDRGTVSIPGVYDNTGRGTKRAKRDDTEQKRKAPKEAKTDARTDTKTDSQVAPPGAPAAAAPQAVDPAAVPPEPAGTGVLATPPSATAATTPPPPAPPAVQQTAAPAAKPTTAPTVGAASPNAPAPKPLANPVQAANSPLGVWLTEEKEGKIRIEQCGANLCGYAANGEQVLINMKPGKDKWSGRIFDPNSGSTYDSSIAMKSPDTLRVQGCAFGGMFCGGQTWTRVN